MKRSDTQASRWFLAPALMLTLACGGTREPLFDAAADADGTPGSAFPDESTTGVTPGTVLAPHDGDLVLTTAGETVEALDVQGCVRVRADDVTLRNVRIRCNAPGGFAVDLGTSLRTLIEAAEIDGLGVVDTLLVGSSFSLRRGSLHGADRGVLTADNGIVESCFVHGLDPSSAYGVQTTGGTGLRVVRSRIEVGEGGAALILGSEQGELRDVLVEGNVLGGGSYTVYAGGSPGDFPASDVRILRNRFLRDARFGPRSLGDGVTWSENVWHDTSEPLP